MTADQYRDAIARLNLTQGAAAKLLGVDPRTSRKWALDEAPVPGSVAGWLDYLWATRNTPAFARLMKQVTN